MRRWRRRSAVAAQTEKEAEEPRPAPTGSVARAVKLKAGLWVCGRVQGVVGKIYHSKSPRENEKQININELKPYTTKRQPQNVP